jgi:hypothetical protein
MGKRTKHERRALDLYPTPERAVPPLIPWLRRDHIRTFAEPCCGPEQKLIGHLEKHGFRCVYRGDIQTGQNALELTREDCNGADGVICNIPYEDPNGPPGNTDLAQDLMWRFIGLGLPVWLICPHDWAANDWFAPFQPHTSDIVPVGRVPWMGKGSGYENSMWYRFHGSHTAGPILHARGRAPTVPFRSCGFCRKPYPSQRSTSKFCGATCRQRAHRSVTASVTENIPEVLR